MKNDLSSLMERENIDVIWIIGSATHNPAMMYFTGEVHVSFADLVLKRGEEPVIFCNPMERDEAAGTGLKVINKAKYDYSKLLDETGGDENKTGALVRTTMFEELEITNGRISIYGKTDLSSQVGVISELQKLLPEIQFIGEGSKSILLEARATKDKNEIERIRKMGEITTGVVSKTAAFLQGCKVRKDEVLLNKNDTPVTVEQVKTKINYWLAEQGVENPEGTIFAIGRDAGIPHSAGKPEDVIRLGKTIVFDIFPQESGGGYFFDFTRTWCLGYAPDAETRLHQDVWSVYQTIMEELEVNRWAPEFQERTCELFEAQGHKTIRQDNQLQSGYVHSLGHGLGLNVHERPWFGKNAGPEDSLDPGSVVTIEPGLYYPEKGMGCRIEDTVYVNPEGKMEILANYPYDLVLPMENWKV
ncbi:MAG: Xaa-Pro peptidase family protein [Anaerolineales bacterium]|nr:Xaa-Pro peptidase family protein [Anaerolineales bacterium]